MFGRKSILHHDYFLFLTAPSTVLENPLHPPDLSLYDFSGSQNKIPLERILEMISSMFLGMTGHWNVHIIRRQVLKVLTPSKCVTCQHQ